MKALRMVHALLVTVYCRACRRALTVSPPREAEQETIRRSQEADAFAAEPIKGQVVQLDARRPGHCSREAANAERIVHMASGMCEAALLERDWTKFDRYFRILIAAQKMNRCPSNPTVPPEPRVVSIRSDDQIDHH
jgi:hypothetical protein